MSYLSIESIDRLTAEAVEQTGAMIALVPREEDAERLSIAGYEPVKEIHLTLAFLGNADQIDDVERAQLTGQVATLARSSSPIVGPAWAAAHFNPTKTPAAVYLVSGRDLSNVQKQVWARLPESYVAVQHTPWIPHVTIGYGLNPARLTLAGEFAITFDRLRIAFGGVATDFRLGG